MHHFQYKNDELHCEDVPLRRIAAEVGTPVYVYSHATLVRHFRAFDDAFAGLPHLTCYSVKANSNLAVLRLFADLGGGVDIVSGGELYRALKAGLPGDRIVFSGVGKTVEEIQDALAADILLFNVESPQELDLLSRTASDLGRKAPIALRVNPDVDPKTHPYVATGLKKSKFGVPVAAALEEYLRAAALPGLEVVGLDCHIGSQLTEVGPFVDALGRLLELRRKMAAHGLHVKYLDLGGGLGITYDSEAPPRPDEYAAALRKYVNGQGLTLLFEPGRVIVGNAGVLLARVLFTKAGEQKDFLVIDGAMNDLIRPSLYDSYHAVQPVLRADRPSIHADVVGPICESGDFLAKDRMLPRLEAGEYIAVMSAGAYGFSMSSNYNSRRRAPEVLVKGDRYRVIRRRESFEDLVRGEEIPDFAAGW
ncbi:MAG: diaminopimelate decarboxylase [Thermodesulfobacteriota bacterium]